MTEIVFTHMFFAVSGSALVLPTGHHQGFWKPLNTKKPWLRGPGELQSLDTRPLSSCPTVLPPKLFLAVAFFHVAAVPSRDLYVGDISPLVQAKQ